MLITFSMADLKELVHGLEDKHLEFKETLVYDEDRETANSALKAAAVKEICALTNNEGGKLIIGVTDDQDVVGIDRDLKVMNHGKDSFERMLNNEMSNRLGKTFASRHTEIHFEEVEGEEVCVVDIEAAHRPVYFDEEFYVRSGSSSRPLSTKEAVDYIRERFDEWE